MFHIQYQAGALRDLRQLDKPVRRRIGDYRVIADIRDDSLVIVALAVGHRSTIYDD